MEVKSFIDFLSDIGKALKVLIVFLICYLTYPWYTGGFSYIQSDFTIPINIINRLLYFIGWWAIVFFVAKVILRVILEYAVIRWVDRKISKFVNFLEADDRKYITSIVSTKKKRWMKAASEVEPIGDKDIKAFDENVQEVKSDVLNFILLCIILMIVIGHYVTISVLILVFIIGYLILYVYNKHVLDDCLGFRLPPEAKSQKNKKPR